MQVWIARSAETDLLEGFAFYERQQAVSETISSAVCLLTSMRLRCSLASIRSLVVACTARSPSAFRSPSHDMRDGIVTVVAVLDCRQNPAFITECLKRS